MAGKRLYITIPARDFRLIQRLSLTQGRCPGHWARSIILSALYATLQVSTDLQDYDAALARQEREEVLRGR